MSNGRIHPNQEINTPQPSAPDPEAYLLPPPYDHITEAKLQAITLIIQPAFLTLLQTIEANVQLSNEIKTGMLTVHTGLPKVVTKLNTLEGLLPNPDEEGQLNPHKSAQKTIETLKGKLDDIRKSHWEPLHTVIKDRKNILNAENLVPEDLDHWHSQLDRVAMQLKQQNPQNIQKQLYIQQAQLLMTQLLDQTSIYNDYANRLNRINVYVTERERLRDRQQNKQNKRPAQSNNSASSSPESKGKVSRNGSQSLPAVALQEPRHIMVQGKEREEVKEESEQRRWTDKELTSDPQIIANIKKNYIAACLSATEAYGFIMDKLTPHLEKLKKVEETVLKVTPVLSRVKREVEKMGKLLPREGQPATNITLKEIGNMINEILKSPDWTFLSAEMQARLTYGITVDSMPPAEFYDYAGGNHTDFFNLSIAQLERFKPQNSPLEKENSDFLKKTQNTRDICIKILNKHKTDHAKLVVDLPQQQNEFEIYKDQLKRAGALVDALQNSQARVSRLSAVDGKSKINPDMAAGPTSNVEHKNKSCVIM